MCMCVCVIDKYGNVNTTYNIAGPLGFLFIRHSFHA